MRFLSLFVSSSKPMNAQSSGIRKTRSDFFCKSLQDRLAQFFNNRLVINRVILHKRHLLIIFLLALIQIENVLWRPVKMYVFDPIELVAIKCHHSRAQTTFFHTDMISSLLRSIGDPCSNLLPNDSMMFLFCKHQYIRSSCNCGPYRFNEFRAI